MSWKNSVDKRQAELATEMSEMKTNYLRRFEIVTDAINNSEKNILKEISIVNQTLASMTAQNKVSRSKGRL